MTIRWLVVSGQWLVVSGQWGMGLLTFPQYDITEVANEKLTPAFGEFLPLCSAMAAAFYDCEGGRDDGGHDTR